VEGLQKALRELNLEIYESLADKQNPAPHSRLEQATALAPPAGDLETGTDGAALAGLMMSTPIEIEG